MNQNVLVYPMFAMLLLSFSVLVRLFRARKRAVREGTTPVAFYRVYQGHAETEEAAKLARNFANLFEAPTLFYVGCLAAMVAGVTGPVLVAVAWCYVVTRIVHTLVHTGPNRIRHRLAIYFIGWLFLLLFWSWLVFSVATRGG
jgi:hypothetical protein